MFAHTAFSLFGAFTQARASAWVTPLFFLHLEDSSSSFTQPGRNLHGNQPSLEPDTSCPQELTSSEQRWGALSTCLFIFINSVYTIIFLGFCVSAFLLLSPEPSLLQNCLLYKGQSMGCECQALKVAIECHTDHDLAEQPGRAGLLPDVINMYFIMGIIRTYRNMPGNFRERRNQKQSGIIMLVCKQGNL